MKQCTSTTFDLVCYDVVNMLRDRLFGERFTDSNTLEGVIEKWIEKSGSHFFLPGVEKSIQLEVYTRLATRNPFSRVSGIRQIKQSLYFKEL